MRSHPVVMRQTEKRNTKKGRNTGKNREMEVGKGKGKGGIGAYVVVAGISDHKVNLPAHGCFSPTHSWLPTFLELLSVP